MKRKILVYVILLGGAINSFSQQKPQYTQYVLNQYIINPAIGGIENYVDVKLSARDIFYSYVSKGSIKYVPNTTGTYRNIYSTQLLTFGFTYSFGKIVDERRKRSTGNAAEAEQNRVRN